jgi:hypothetical protein
MITEPVKEDGLQAKEGSYIITDGFHEGEFKLSADRVGAGRKLKKAKSSAKKKNKSSKSSECEPISCEEDQASGFEEIRHLVLCHNTMVEEMLDVKTSNVLLI